MTERAKQIEIPEVGLVVLVGASGAGKSTFANAHFRATEVVSSDRCRALVGDDETDQAVTGPAFELLHTIVEKRLALGRLAVVDATNIRPEDRRPLIEIARRWDVLATAIVFDLPLDVCLERNATRTDRQTPEHAIKRQHRTVRRTARGLRKERFGRVYTISTPDEMAAVSVTRSKIWNDKRDDAGPFDIIGDVHGCGAELRLLLAKLGYDATTEPFAHPAGRRVIFLGDLVDRGPAVTEVLDVAMSMVEAGTALCILGNHENKLGRALAGRNVTVSHGLAESLEQLDQRPEEYRTKVAEFIDGLVSHYVLDGGSLVVAHAGLPERYHGRASGRVRSIALYGDTSGETDDYGLPVRYPWAEDYRGTAAVVYGHTPVPVAGWLNNTICLDTGAVFGGELTALRWPEKELVSVGAETVHYEPTRPLESTETQRAHRLIAVTDVLGKHYIETSLAGRITIAAERSSAAIEVMSRFATDARWLVHLPPTMAPVATSDRPDFLEHPDEAFAFYRDAGVDEVVCEEKHMGSRCVAVLAKDPDVAARRFGISNAAGGVLLTRTGRPFFTERGRSGGGAGGSLEATLVGRLRAAIDTTGLWEELETDWLVLDAELLPWSAKALELLQSQYAATGAAGTGTLSAAVDLLAKAQARSIESPASGQLAELADRTSVRHGDMEAYVEAYRQYCWPVDGVEGIEIAPFQLLAGEGEVLARQPHRWHLDRIDRLVANDPALIRSTDRRFVPLHDSEALEEATEWWLSMTSTGGEGMVVKPADGIVAGERGLVLPGVKCRGREYLRIIYGPEYLQRSNLDRLRRRGLGRKSALARREFALGIEALDRFVANEHLFRVHECVFGVLALESEPVDPRL